MSNDGVDASSAKMQGAEKFRCPELNCTGWIEDISDVSPVQWGCGECGNVWADSAALEGSIRHIVKRFAHRKQVYKVLKSSVVPVPLAAQPSNYEQQVSTEWDAAA